jgi:predicted HicB family RNase H-like nuclease
MAKTEPFLVRMEPELAEQVRARAKEKGLSMNEWLNRAIKAALASQAKGLTITTITKVEI